MDHLFHSLRGNARRAAVCAAAGKWVPLAPAWTGASHPMGHGSRRAAAGARPDRPRTDARLGPRIFNLQIALTAFTHGGVELWTHDRAFVKIPGPRLVHPLVATKPVR